jgi:arylsulfatase A-like enzyme
VVISDGWKLQRAERPPRSWLFHLRDDPTEQANLAASRPDKVAELARLLDAHNAAQAEPLWRARAELPVLIDKHLAEPQSPIDEYVYVPN